jgi:hypothetical protein
VALLAIAGWSFARARRTARWPQVVARVTEVSERSSVGTAAFTAEPIGEVLFRVEASYLIGGRPVEATLYLNAPPGGEILLAYNPQRPTEAIVPSYPASGVSLVLLALAVLFGAAAVLW